MAEMINVNIYGEDKVYEAGTTYLEISREYQERFDADIILVKADGSLRELNKKLTQPCTLSFVTTKESAGYKTYYRGMIFVMMKAFYSVFGPENVRRIRVEHSVGNGYYCEIEKNDTPEGEVYALTETELEKAKQEMKRIIEADIPFVKRTETTANAEKIFHAHKMYDKEKLFRYRRVSKTNMYSLGGFEDYYYGYMPPSTKYLKLFELQKYEAGFILVIPRQDSPNSLMEFSPLPKLFNTLQEANKWATIMGIETVGALNEEISKGNIGDIILVQEAFMEKKIGEIAEQIKKAGNKKFIMIAGPSSSGKTTFSHRLSIQLRTLGMKPHPIGVDDYFVNREDTPKDENGEYNYECLEAIDVKQFNEDMNRLLAGETVELPTFNFKTGKREYKGNFKKLGPDDVLVIEGIHGLNDKLSYNLPTESKFKIYISALTQLNIDEHNRIPTTDARLIRRIVRDARTRGADATATIKMWPSVRRGEEENIFPYQECADVMINSALIYELSILKQYAEPLLFSVDRNAPEYAEAKRLLKFLDYFLGVSSEGVPNNSIIREFIGNSCFKV